MTDKYILNGHIPVPEPDLMAWASGFDTANRVVSQTRRGNVLVSTVFLGLDHNHTNNGPPLLFETMIFKGDDEDYQERCSTWDEAVKMHARACNRAFGYLKLVS